MGGWTVGVGWWDGGGNGLSIAREFGGSLSGCFGGFHCREWMLRFKSIFFKPRLWVASVHTALEEDDAYISC